MTTTDESILIAATAETVFDYLDDPSHLPVFDPTILSAELVGDGPMAVGSRVRGRSKILGQTFDWTIEVTAHDWPTKLAVKSVEGRIDFATTYTLTTEAGGTRVHYRLDSADGLGGVFGDTPDDSVETVGARQSRANLATHAEILADHGRSGQ